MADVDLEAPSPDQRNALCARFPFLATPYAAAFPLHEAARSNDWRTLNDLVLAQPPVDINVRDADGNTALHVAAAAYAIEVC